MADDWEPDPNGLAQVVELANMARTPGQHQETHARLTEYNQIPDFNVYLCYAFAFLDSEPPETRMMIGIILKDNVTRQWKNMSPEVQHYIMEKAPIVLADPTLPLREVCGALITCILAQTKLTGWINLIDNLILALDDENTSLVHGAIGTLSKICEDHSRELSQVHPELPTQPIDILIPKLYELLASDKVDMVDMALKCITHLIPSKPSPFLLSIKHFFDLLFSLAENPPNVPILVSVCKTFDALVFGRVTAIVDYMPSVVQYMLAMTGSESVAVGLAASNFWSTIADTEICYEALSPYLQSIVETLLRHMRYSAYELEQLPDVEEEVMDPDRPENTLPTTGKITMGDDIDASYDTSMGVSEQTVRKSCGKGLEDLAELFGEDLLEVIIPLCQQGLQSENWLDREACILALGATSRCFLEAGNEHLNGLVPMLLQLLDDPRPLIRHISAWTVSRYATWIAEPENENMLQSSIQALARRLSDRSKQVLEWSLQALAILAEAAQEQMRDFVDALLPIYMELFNILHGRPLAKLLDALGALCQSTGEALSQSHLLEMLMPPLMARWEQIDENDEKSSPIFDCMTRICLALGMAFSPWAVPVFERCPSIMQTHVMAAAMEKENGGASSLLGEESRLGPSSNRMLVSALELLSGLFEALKSGAADLASDWNLLALLVEVLKDTSVDVSRASFCLVGDIASTCYALLVPALDDIIPILISDIRPRIMYVSLSLNACWALTEIAVHAREAMAPYAEEIVRRVVNVIHDHHQANQFRLNAAILLGAIACPLPSIVAVNLENFLGPWADLITNLEENDDKKQTTFGMLAAVRENPEAALQCFDKFAAAVASWSLPPNALREGFIDIFAAYSQQLGPEVWPQVLKGIDDDSRNVLEQWYL